MATFDNAIDTAKVAIKAWSDFARLSEITIIRDIFGNLSFLFSGKRSEKEDLLRTSLSKCLSPYTVNHLYWDEEIYDDITSLMIDEIKKCRFCDDPSKPCSWYRLERAVAKKAWIAAARTSEPVWPYDDAKDGKQPKVVTFYSFKGGMGRTTTLVATALLLAQHGRSVLAIDTDIEAPGLSSLFFDDAKIEKGTVDFFLEPSADSATDMDAYISQVTDPVVTDGLSGYIYVVPAGSVNDNYVQKLGRIDCQDTVPNAMRNRLALLIQNSVNYVLQHGGNVDYVLLDARAGFHDISGVTTAHLPHGAVLFGRDNSQSWAGLKQVAFTLARAQSEPLPIALVDSLCPALPEGGQERNDFKNQAYTTVCEVYYLETDEAEPGIDAKDVAHSPIHIPYVPLLGQAVTLYSDGSEAQNDRVKQLRSVLSGEDYLAVESRIRQWFGDTREEGETGK